MHVLTIWNRNFLLPIAIMNWLERDAEALRANDYTFEGGAPVQVGLHVTEKGDSRELYKRKNVLRDIDRNTHTHTHTQARTEHTKARTEHVEEDGGADLADAVLDEAGPLAAVGGRHAAEHELEHGRVAVCDGRHEEQALAAPVAGHVRQVLPQVVLRHRRLASEQQPTAPAARARTRARHQTRPVRVAQHRDVKLRALHARALNRQMAIGNRRSKTT